MRAVEALLAQISSIPLLISHEGVKMIYGYYLTVGMLNTSGQNDESEEFSGSNIKLVLKSNTLLLHCNRNRKRL